MSAGALCQIAAKMGQAFAARLWHISLFAPQLPCKLPLADFAFFMRMDYDTA
jgi:hypothetical protein